MRALYAARGVVVSIVCLAAGCATFDGQVSSHLTSPGEAVRDCARWYGALDAQVDAAGVRDAQQARMDGFPYFRIDRLLASLRERAAGSEAAFSAYTARLLALDGEARRHEIENLPREAVAALPGMTADQPRRAALARTLACGRQLRDADRAQPGARQALLEAARVPDDYSEASRLFGLYPLTRIAFAGGISRWEDETRATFAKEPAQSGPGSVRYAPPPAVPPLSRAAAAAFLSRAEFDPLGLPVLSPGELARFAAAYAPTFEVGITGDFDRFGELRWRRGKGEPQVEAAESVVYVNEAHARYRDANGMERILLQLVYTIWFPERPPEHEGDILAGALDGLVWRVTLAPDGEPLIYDSIHACGCYHQFFPTPRARVRPSPDALEEWAFVPRGLPRVGEGERPVVRIATRTHYIEGVTFARGADSLARYELRDYDELRSLRRMDGGARSVFGPDGIIAGTQRAERFLFWPMGIRSAGAMRQWGRQATAFIGRRHFDDADLIERRFDIDFARPSP